MSDRPFEKLDSVIQPRVVTVNSSIPRSINNLSTEPTIIDQFRKTSMSILTVRNMSINFNELFYISFKKIFTNSIKRMKSNH